MPQESVRVPDQYTESTAQQGTGTDLGPLAIELASNEVPVSDDGPDTRTVTYTVAAAGATVDLASTNATDITAKNATVTAVTYTPGGNQAAPSAGNSRSYTLTGNGGTIATYTFSSVSPAFTSGSPIAFALGVTAVSEETLKLASAHVSAGAVDPGGTLTVTYRF